MQFMMVVPSLLAFITNAASATTHTSGNIDARQSKGLCAGSDFATIFEVRVCQRYNAPTCEGIVYSIADCSYDKLLYWGCNDDDSGAFDGVGGYYARIDMEPDTTNMTCVNESLHQLFPGKTDLTLNITECGESKDTEMQERDTSKPVDEKGFRCSQVQDFDHVEYHIQVGAPYDTNHCTKIKSALVNWCLKGSSQGQFEDWKCDDDGITACKDGTTGAYDLRFALHTGYSACVDQILDDMFPEVRNNTGGFTCNSETS